MTAGRRKNRSEEQETAERTKTIPEEAGSVYNIPIMKFSWALTFLTACAFAQETPTEREAARAVLQKMDALEQSLDEPGWVTKLSAPDAARPGLRLPSLKLRQCTRHARAAHRIRRIGRTTNSLEKQDDAT